ncbi:MAG TPA: GNAT family N-acetyltransferase [Chryseosolibacter sp.]
MITISEATLDDIPAIIDIAEKTWWPTYSKILSADQIRYMLDAIYSATILRKQIADGSQTFLTLTDEGTIKGFASFSKRTEDPAVFKLHKLYVLPERQSKGYGRMLVNHVMNRLLEENIHALDLNVNRHNPARRFYEKLGFRVLREEDIPIGPYWMNDYVMRIEF